MGFVVPSSVPGFARKHGDIGTDAIDGAFPFMFDPVAKQQVVVRRCGEPSVFKNFPVQLAGTPAGISQRQYASVRPSSFGDGPENIDGRGQADLAVDQECGLLDIVGGMQYETAAGLDRSTEMDANRVADGGWFDVELLKKVWKAQTVEQPIDHEPHCAFGGVGAEIHQGPRKSRILHLRHGDQHLSG